MTEEQKAILNLLCDLLTRIEELTDEFKAELTEVMLQE